MDELSARFLRRLSRWWAASGLALFAATWRLWTLRSDFPQVPLFEWCGRLPVVLEWFCLALVAGSLLATSIVRAQLARPAWAAFAIAVLILLCVDQLRLQPWVYQLLLMSLVFIALPSGVGVRLLKLLTVSIYFWSAVSKLDTRFFATHGQTLAAALWQCLGLTPPTATVGWYFAALLPLGELMIAILLLFARVQRAGAWCAIGLHGVLLLVLGPLGLQHRPGVLIWNFAFIGHVWLLYSCRNSNDDLVAGLPSQSDARRIRPVKMLIWFAILWPLSEPWGFCDRWLAWSLYSACVEQVSVALTDAGMQRLPESARSVVTNGVLPLDRWSLEAIGAPIYPQLRFQVGVVEWLRRRCGDENVIELTLQTARGGAKIPWQHERMTLGEWQARSQRFWLNTQPR